MAWSEYSSNVLTNPGAEAGNTSGWTTQGGGTLEAANNDIYNITVSNVRRSGSYGFVWGGATNSSTWAYQDVTLTNYVSAANIDAGRMRVQAGGWGISGENAWGTPYDQYAFRIQVLNGSSSVIATPLDTGLIGPDTNPWTNHEIVDYVIPNGGRTLRFWFRAIETDYEAGSIDDTYVYWSEDVGAGVEIAINPAGMTLASQSFTPVSGVEIDINPAAQTLAAQAFTPTAGIDVPINPATLTQAGQPFTPVAGVEIELQPAYLNLAGQMITPVAGTPPNVEIPLNPANLTLAGQPLTPEVGVDIPLNPAALTLAAQAFTPTAGAIAVEITINPANLTLVAQAFTPAAGAEPVEITINPAALTMTAQSFIPQVSNLDPVVIPINPTHTYLTAKPFMVEITGPGQLVGLSQPGTCTVATTNMVSGDGSHYHEITASSNPGAAAALLKSAVDGSLDLTNLRLSGDLAVNGGDITSTGNMAITPGGTLALNALLESHLRPSLTDTYDLGSELKLWRKAWISEMQAVLFVENTISAIGGWFIVPHGQGTMGDEVDDTQTQIDFGQAMTPTDFIIMRGLTDGGLPKVEYMQVGALVSGTTYTVTRNVDGSGANAWPQGQVYIVLGNTGNGRIELDAQTAGPRISVLEQGAAYNSQTERVRLGELTGWKSGVSGYGIGIGDPNGTHLYYTPTSGLVIAADGSGMTNIDGGEIQTGTVTADAINVSTLSAISANLGTVTAGSLSGVSASFGGGNVLLGSDGIQVASSVETSWQTLNKRITFGLSVQRYGYIAGMYNSIGALKSLQLAFLSDDGATKGAVLDIYSTGAGFYVPGGKFVVTGGYGEFGSDLRIGGGLYVGATDADPDPDDIHFDGNLKSVKSSVAYDVYGYHGLASATIITGDTSLTGSNTTGAAIDISAAVPAAATAVKIRVRVWGDTLGQYVYFGSGNTSAAERWHVGEEVIVVNRGQDSVGDITLATAQTIYRIYNAAGGTVHYLLYVLGYYI